MLRDRNHFGGRCFVLQRAVGAGRTQQIRLRSLPGDVNNDRTSNPALNLGALIDCINTPGSCFDFQENIDRTGLSAGVLTLLGSSICSMAREHMIRGPALLLMGWLVRLSDGSCEVVSHWRPICLTSLEYYVTPRDLRMSYSVSRAIHADILYFYARVLATSAESRPAVWCLRMLLGLGRFAKLQCET